MENKAGDSRRESGDSTHGLIERLRIRWRAAGLSQKLAAGLVSAVVASIVIQAVWGMVSIGGSVWWAALVPLFLMIAGIFLLLSIARVGTEDIVFIVLTLVAGYFYFVGSYSYTRDFAFLLFSLILAPLFVTRFRHLFWGRFKASWESINNLPRAELRDVVAKRAGEVRRVLRRLMFPLRHPAETSRVIYGKVSLVRDPLIPFHSEHAKLLLAFLLVAWVLLTVADELGRPATLSHDYRGRALGSKDTGWGDRQVGLALSGGGYRAALLHAGVLSELDEIGVPIGAISSVSGGAIIGSFYALGGSPRDFVEAVAGGRFNLKREISHVHNFIPLAATSRWPFSSYKVVPFTGNYGPSQVQAALLDKVLLGGTRMKNAGGGELPELMLCVTDLSTKRVVGVTRRGLIGHELLPAVRRTPAENTLKGSPAAEGWSGSAYGIPGDLPLSTFVAASGAFPGPFNPVEVDGEFDLSNEAIPEEERTVFRRQWSLADGGIADNLGLDLMLVANFLARRDQSDTEVRQNMYEDARKEPGLAEYLRSQEVSLSEWDVSLMIASDGGAFYQQTDTRPDSYTAELARAIDTIYATSGSQFSPPEPRHSRMKRTPPLILLTPTALADRVNEFEVAMKASTLTANRFVYDAPPPRVVGQPSIYYGFTSLGRERLGEMIRRLPEKAAGEARRLMRIIESQGGLTGVNTTTGLPDEVDCGGAADGGHQLFCLLRKDLDECLSAFVSTSTLEDNIDAERAERIYRLGRYLVSFNVSAIERVVQTDQPRTAEPSK